ncbi:MAG: lysoplasmalogenase [Bacteroidota bacterium]
MKFVKAFIILFLINLSLDIYFHNTKGLHEFRIFTKPIITLSLAIYFYVNSYALQMRKRLIIVGALLLLCIADIFLLETTSFYSLMSALSLSLVAILFYSLYFYKQTHYDIDRLIPFLAVSLLICLAVFYLMYEKLDKMLIPVMIYMATILNFLKIAYLRYKSVSLQSYRLVFIGVAFFTITQIIIGLSKFYKTLPFEDLYIMLFYGISQLLIIFGILVMIHSDEKLTEDPLLY